MQDDFLNDIRGRLGQFVFVSKLYFFKIWKANKFILYTKILYKSIKTRHKLNIFVILLITKFLTDFLKIISAQNQLPITFSSDLGH